MARGSLFGRYRKRVEEIRVKSLSPEELHEEAFQKAQERVEDAHHQIEALKKEFQSMDAKHCLSMMPNMTLKIGRYSPGEPDTILEWWRGWVKRSHAAQVEFDESLKVWAALKGVN